MSATQPTEAAVLAALEKVLDPDLGRSIVAMEMVRDLSIAAETIGFTCELTTPACPAREKIEADIRAVISAAFPAYTLALKMSARVRGFANANQRERPNLLPQIKHVILIASGKGGVGKSVIGLNLAFALQTLGAKVALLDLDIYGPSQPQLLGIAQKPRIKSETKIDPILVDKLQTMSMGYLVPPRQAMVWRGQVVDGLIAQFLQDVLWLPADYMLIDMPPGTGDVTHGIVQRTALSGVVLIATPDELSQSVVKRADAVFEQYRIPRLGIIENRSSRSPEPEQLLDHPLLGCIPESPLLQGPEAGQIARRGTLPLSGKFAGIARQLAAHISIQAMQISS